LVAEGEGDPDGVAGHPGGDGGQVGLSGASAAVADLGGHREVPLAASLPMMGLSALVIGRSTVLTMIDGGTGTSAPGLLSS